MTDYGHAFVNGRNFHIDSWGHGPLFLEVGGKVHRFEDSDRFGPSRLNKTATLQQARIGPSAIRFGERIAFGSSRDAAWPTMDKLAFGMNRRTTP